MTESSELQTVPGLVNITNEKAMELRSLGFNVLRVGIHWSLYEVAPNTYNETYLSELVELVNRLGNVHKFFIILDMHQDQLSERFCAGHGVPPFYAKVRGRKYQRGGRRAYPWPVAAPRYENQTHRAPFIDCSTFLRKHKGSAVDLYTYYMGKAFQEIYDNIDGKLDAFGRFWQRVAKKFHASPYVLAYEILNEPWYGEVDLIRGGGVDGWTVNDTVSFQWANVQNFQNKLNKQLHKPSVNMTTAPSFCGNQQRAVAGTAFYRRGLRKALVAKNIMIGKHFRTMCTALIQRRVVLGGEVLVAWQT